MKMTEMNCIYFIALNEPISSRSLRSEIKAIAGIGFAKIPEPFASKNLLSSIEKHGAYCFDNDVYIKKNAAMLDVIKVVLEFY